MTTGVSAAPIDKVSKAPARNRIGSNLDRVCAIWQIDRQIDG